MTEKDIDNALALVKYTEGKLKRHRRLVNRLDLISKERIEYAILYLQMAEDHLKLEQRRVDYE